MLGNTFLHVIQNWWLSTGFFKAIKSYLLVPFEEETKSEARCKGIPASVTSKMEKSDFEVLQKDRFYSSCTLAPTRGERERKREKDLS